VPDDLPDVYLDLSKFEQVLINLIINATHAMADVDSPRLEIVASYEDLENVVKNQGARKKEVFRSGDRVVHLEIKDNGHGIDSKDSGRVFDPFFTTKATGQGTGLGLSVSRKIVALHAGELTLKNREDTTGAVAKITLPTKLDSNA